jgi:DNA-binding CsgD family transcriptional regulator
VDAEPIGCGPVSRWSTMSGMRLLERAGARAELLAALDALQQGTGGVVLVRGEAGIGKTSLVRAFRDEVGTRALVLAGGCDDLAVPRPLGAVLELADGVPGLAARLADSADATRTLLAALRDRPTVCLVEDVHWADEATLDVLSSVVRRVAELPVLLVLTFRDDEVPAGHPLRRTLAAVPAGLTRRIALPALTLDAVRRLAGPATDAAAVHAVTGGNPFFVTEVLSAGGPDRTPASVRDAVLGRFARLGPAARATAELVAVVPGRTEAWLVEACLGDGADVAGGEAQGLLVVEAGGVRYRHELARWAVEEELTGQRRRELNRTVLRELAERGAPDARLAHHAWRAGDADAVVRHGLAAAEQAARARSHREAAELLARVLAHDELLAPRVRADAYDTFSREAYSADQRDRALAAGRQACALRRELGDPRRLSDSLRWLSRVSWWVGDRPGAEQVGREAVATLAGAPACRELAMALSNQSQLAMLANRDEEADELGRAAIDAAEQVGDVETVLHARVNRGTSFARRDLAAGIDELTDTARAALAAGYDDHACRALVNAAWSAMEQHANERARQLTDEALAVVLDREQMAYAEYLLTTRARLDLLAGRWDLDLDLDIDRIVGHAVHLVPAFEVRGLLALRRGEPGAAALLDRAWSMAIASRELQRLRPAACARAEAAWLRGDPAAVDAATAEVFALALDRGCAWDVGELAVWRARAGLLDEVPDPCAEPYALEITGQPEAAAERWRRLGEPYAQALALLGSADPAEVGTAVDLLDRLGATAVVPVARARLRALGVRTVPRGRRPSTRSNPAGLTERQVEVLGLVATGLSNTEIARRLVLSPKTVEHHVGAVLAKLGVPSRADAVAAARRLGMAEPEDGGGPAPR